MTFEEKMKVLEEYLFNMCTENDSCNGCPFDDDENAYMDEKIGMCSCGLRDCFSKFPHQPSWDIKTALGLEEPYKPVFPEAVEESINILREENNMGSCETCKHQNKTAHEEPCKGCTHNATDNYESITNADRIRSMSDEELAEWLTTITNDAQRAIVESQCFVDYQWKEWLQSEVEDEQN